MFIDWTFNSTVLLTTCGLISEALGVQRNQQYIDPTMYVYVIADLSVDAPNAPEIRPPVLLA
jgi:hypothetical protein